MNKDQYYMDGVIRNKLIDYRQSAPKEVWNNIEESLNANNKPFFNFYKVAAAVLALAVLGSAYFFFSVKDKTENIEMVADNDQNLQVNESIPKKSINSVQPLNIAEKESNEGVAKYENIDHIAESDVKLIDNTPEKNQENVLIAEVRKADVAKLNSLSVGLQVKSPDLKIVDLEKKTPQPQINTLPDIYSTYALIEPDETVKEKKNRWLIGGEFTPLYSYRHITGDGGSSVKDYYNQVESPVMSYTGGINVQYKAIDRLTVQAGIYYSTMGQSIDQMTVYANEAYYNVPEEYRDRYINSYSIKNSSGDISFNTPYVIIDERLSRVENTSEHKIFADVSDPIFNDTGAELEQSFEYIEIPVIVRYKLIDRLVDFNILGGIGANFLIGNNVYLIESNDKENIGSTNGVNDVNYSGSLGFGIDYPLMKRINLRLEPSIKYYLNPINSNSSVESHPYSFGIYTGINYSF